MGKKRKFMCQTEELLHCKELFVYHISMPQYLALADLTAGATSVSDPTLSAQQHGVSCI